MKVRQEANNHPKFAALLYPVKFLVIFLVSEHYVVCKQNIIVEQFSSVEFLLPKQ